jgi:hypothetical protein
MAYGRKFTADDVRAIRRMRADGVAIIKIAIAFSVNRETIERVLSRATYGWVPLNELDLVPEEKRAEALKQKADESFERLQVLLATPPVKAPEKDVLEILRARTKPSEPAPQTVQEPQKFKRYHPLLAQGWRYCDGQLASPEDIEMLGLVPDEDQAQWDWQAEQKEKAE